MEVTKDQMTELILSGLGKDIDVQKQVLTAPDRAAIEAWKAFVVGGPIPASDCPESMALQLAAAAQDEEGLSELVKAIEQAPTPIGYAALGLTLLRCNQAEMIVRFLPVVLRGGMIGRCLYVLGLIKLNRRDLVTKEMSNVVCLDDSSPLVMFTQAYAAMILGDPQEAHSLFRDGLGLSKQLLQGCGTVFDQSALDNFRVASGACQLLKGMEPEAMDELRNVVTRGPDILANLVKAFQAYDNSAEAMKTFQELTEVAPDHDLVRRYQSLQAAFASTRF